MESEQTLQVNWEVGANKNGSIRRGEGIGLREGIQEETAGIEGHWRGGM